MYDDRVTALARWIRVGLTVLLAAGCASTNLTSAPPSEPSIDIQLAQAAAFRAGNHRDAALATLDRVLKRVAQQGGPPVSHGATDDEDPVIE